MTTFMATIVPSPAILDCGHKPEPSPYTKGYVINPLTRKSLCFACMADVIRADMLLTPVGVKVYPADADKKVYGLIVRGMTYVTDKTVDTTPLHLTTWNGVVLTTEVTIVNFNVNRGRQVAFRFRFGGRVWSGRCNRYGGKVYCRPTKLKSLVA